MRDRREIRAVGFHQQAIGRRAGRGLAQRVRLRKRRDARDRDAKAGAEGAGGGLRITCEAVKHPAELALPFFGDDTQGVLLRLASVDHDWEVALQRQLDLGAEYRVLHLARREVVVIVEANLANRPSLRHRREAFGHNIRGALRIGLEGLGVMRMNTDGQSALRPRREDGNGAGNFCVVFGRQDHQRPRRSGRPRPCNHLRKVGDEFFAGDMAVRVGHRTRVPGGAGSEFSTIALPPSGLAASTIPFDSSPIILRGARLATITIDLPTSASGSYDSAMPARIVLGSASPASTFSFSSRCDFGIRSASRTLAVFSSIFAKSSMVMVAGAAVAGAA